MHRLRAKQTNKPESSKICAGSKKSTNAKPRCNVRGQGLIGVDVCMGCILLSLCRFQRFLLWAYFAFFELLQVLELWLLKSCQRKASTKMLGNLSPSLQKQVKALDLSCILEPVASTLNDLV